MRSVLLVDPCNLFCPRVDFDPEIYKVEQINITTDEFHYLRTLSEKMLRTVSFFDYRVLFYSYLLTIITLNAEYVKPFNIPIQNDNDHYNDIVQLLQKNWTYKRIKLIISPITLNANHFPIFDIFHANDE